MSKSVRIQLFIISFTFVLGIGMGGILTDMHYSNKKVDNSVLGVQEESKGKLPSVANMAPSEARVGVPYSYDMKVIDGDSDLLSISIVEAPMWLFNDSFKFYGIPSVSDVGTHRVDVLLKDEKNEVPYSYYIVVYE